MFFLHCFDYFVLLFLLALLLVGRWNTILGAGVKDDGEFKVSTNKYYSVKKSFHMNSDF